MARTPEELFREALQLTDDQREELLRLLTSAAGPEGWISADIEQAWVEECDRREQAVAEGRMRLVPGDEAFRTLRQMLRG